MNVFIEQKMPKNQKHKVHFLLENSWILQETRRCVPWVQNPRAHDHSKGSYSNRYSVSGFLFFNEFHKYDNGVVESEQR